jgi:hypothetical protein
MLPHYDNENHWSCQMTTSCPLNNVHNDLESINIANNFCTLCAWTIQSFSPTYFPFSPNNYILWWCIINLLWSYVFLSPYLSTLRFWCKMYSIVQCARFMMQLVNQSSTNHFHILLNPCFIVIFAFNTLVNQREYFLSFQIPLYPLCFVMKLHITLWFIWHSRLRNFGFCEMNGCWTNQWNWELLLLQLYLLSPPLLLCVKFCLCTILWTNVNDVWHFSFCITILHYFTLDFV